MRHIDLYSLISIFAYLNNALSHLFSSLILVLVELSYYFFYPMYDSFFSIVLTCLVVRSFLSYQDHEEDN